MLAERFQHPGELTHCESALGERLPDRGCAAGFRGGDRHDCAAKARNNFGNHPLVLTGHQTRRFVVALRFRCRRISDAGIHHGHQNAGAAAWNSACSEVDFLEAPLRRQ